MAQTNRLISRGLSSNQGGVEWIAQHALWTVSSDKFDDYDFVVYNSEQHDGKSSLNGTLAGRPV